MFSHKHVFMLKCKQISHKPIYIVIVTAYFNPLNFYVVQMISVTQKVFRHPIHPDSQTVHNCFDCLLEISSQLKLIVWETKSNKFINYSYVNNNVVNKWVRNKQYFDHELQCDLCFSSYTLPVRITLVFKSFLVVVSWNQCIRRSC